MAVTRKYLKSIGLNEDQIEGVIEEHTASLEGLKNEVEKYKADALKLADIQKELDELKKGDSEDWKGKYEAEKAAHDQTRSDYAAKETAAVHERLFRAELSAVGITGKRADQIVKLTDMSAFKVKDGAYEDAKAVQDHIRTEYSEFVPTTTTKGASVATPPGNAGAKMTREQIAGIKSPAERRAAIAANPELFSHM